MINGKEINDENNNNNNNKNENENENCKRLRKIGISIEENFNLSLFSNLEELRINFYPISWSLDNLSYFTKLNKLKYQGPSRDIISKLSELRSLKHLNLIDNCHLNENILINLVKLTNLQTLKLTFIIDESESSSHYWKFFGYFTFLDKIDLKIDGSIGECDKNISEMKKLTNLRKLHIKNVKINEIGIEKGIQYFINLCELSLRGGNLTDNSLLYLKEFNKINIT